MKLFVIEMRMTHSLLINLWYLKASCTNWPPFTKPRRVGADGLHIKIEGDIKLLFGDCNILWTKIWLPAINSSIIAKLLRIIMRPKDILMHSTNTKTVLEEMWARLLDFSYMIFFQLYYKFYCQPPKSSQPESLSRNVVRLWTQQ